MKIILISPLLQPYRISFYQKLNRLFDGFKVYYSIQKQEAGRPQHKKDVDFYARGFREYKISIFGFSVLFVSGMFRAIKEELPDVIIIQGIPGNLTYRTIVNWASGKNIKVIFWYCGWEPNKKRSFLLHKVKNLLAMSYYRKGDCFLTYSTKARNDLIERKLNPNSLKVAYNGIDLDYYKDISQYTASSVPLKERHKAKDKIYLYVGGLLEEKRVLFLIDAFIEFRYNFPGTQLWIIGDGPQREEVEKMIINHPGIKYFGRIIENVEPFFIAADYFVLPGTGGLAINQAMFFETPCIVGRADGTERDLVIEGVTGFNFVEDDKESLISRLSESFFLKEEDYNVMKKKGKELIVKKSNVNNMIAVFQEAISERQHAH